MFERAVDSGPAFLMNPAIHCVNALAETLIRIGITTPVPNCLKTSAIETAPGADTDTTLPIVLINEVALVEATTIVFAIALMDITAPEDVIETVLLMAR